MRIGSEGAIAERELTTVAAAAVAGRLRGRCPGKEQRLMHGYISEPLPLKLPRCVSIWSDSMPITTCDVLVHSISCAKYHHEDECRGGCNRPPTRPTPPPSTCSRVRARIPSSSEQYRSLGNPDTRKAPHSKGSAREHACHGAVSA
jgi:hypothetical protein